MPHATYYGATSGELSSLRCCGQIRAGSVNRSCHGTASGLIVGVITGVVTGASVGIAFVPARLARPGRCDSPLLYALLPGLHSRMDLILAQFSATAGGLRRTIQGGAYAIRPQQDLLAHQDAQWTLGILRHKSINQIAITPAQHY